MIDAKKTTLKEKEALALAAEVDDIYVAKGKKITYLDLRKAKADKETLKGLLLGRTGNLRAPTLRVGKTLIVGFDRETYQKVFR